MYRSNPSYFQMEIPARTTGSQVGARLGADRMLSLAFPSFDGTYLRTYHVRCRLPDA
jgi:hypothetical protein